MWNYRLNPGAFSICRLQTKNLNKFHPWLSRVWTPDWKKGPMWSDGKQTKNEKKIPGRSWLFTVILVYSTLKLVTIFRYWWHNFDIGGIFWMFVPGSPALKSHKAITKLVTPTQFVSNNRHQHRCNQNSVYRQFSRIIDVTLEENIFEEKWPGAWLSINIVNVLQ